jgi:putative tryptophan/tyrosine transport system substrate-binding protein
MGSVVTNRFLYKRREFMLLLGGAAACALGAGATHAQQSVTPVVGYLSVRSNDNYLVEALRRGLRETGYVEGQNVAIEYRWAMGRYDRMPAMAAELARLPLAVLVTAGGEPAALAAKAATSTIPIVFVIGGDPVKVGLVASYNQPGGNATGTSILTPTMEAKRLGLLHELVPQATSIAVILNPNFPPFEGQERDVQQAGRALGIDIRILRAGSDREIEAAFETIAQQRIGAVLVGSDPFFDSRRDQLVGLAMGQMVPTLYHFREFAAAGGLASYGVDISDSHRQMGVYVGRILKGAKPADLPVLQPTKLELIINIKAARALALQVPDKLLALADEVIE